MTRSRQSVNDTKICHVTKTTEFKYKGAMKLYPIGTLAHFERGGTIILTT